MAGNRLPGPCCATAFLLQVWGGWRGTTHRIAVKDCHPGTAYGRVSPPGPRSTVRPLCAPLGPGGARNPKKTPPRRRGKVEKILMQQLGYATSNAAVRP